MDLESQQMSEYKAGEFKKYKACVGFVVGLLERTLTIGEVLEYDGFKARFESGEELSLPNFRSCIKQRWLVGEHEELVPYRPKSAGIQPRPAIADEVQTQNPNTPRFSVSREEDQVVSHIGSHGTPEGTPQGHAQVGSHNRIASTQPSQVEARVGSGGSTDFEVIAGDGDQIVVSSPSFGGGAQISGEGGTVNLEFTKIGSVNVPSDDHPFQSGVKLGQPSKGRSMMEDVDQSELDAAQVSRGLDPSEATHEYLLDEAEEAPKKKATRKKAAKKKSAKKVVKSGDSNFKWNLQGHWKTRLKKAMEYKDEPETMIKILAKESPTQSAKILTAWKEYQSKG